MRLLPLILLPALLTSPSFADTDQFATLVQQLSSNEYATREDATQKLVHLGEPALPRLQQLLPSITDGEARNRVQSAIDQIAESSVAGETFLTLDVTDADPKTVFAELAKQAHADINPSPADLFTSLPKITFRCDHESFWPALRRLCSPLGLQPELLAANGMGMVRRPQQASADHALTLVRSAPGAWDKTPTTFAGPFMIAAQQITQTSVILPAINQRTHSLLVQCTVYAEPKLTVLGRNPTAIVTDPDPAAQPAPAPNGNVFIPGMVNPRIPFGNRNYYNATAASAWPLIIPLVRPAAATDKLPHLKASTTAKVLLRSESWDVANIIKVAPRTWTVAGRTVTVKSVTWEGTNVKLLATASHKLDRALDPNNDEYAIFNSVELLTDDGRSLPALNRAPSPSDNPAALIGYTIQFDSTRDGLPLAPPKTPLRLRWRIPLESKDITLPIEFSDLPLP